jgi:hypothetical protein
MTIKADVSKNLLQKVFKVTEGNFFPSEQIQLNLRVSASFSLRSFKKPDLNQVRLFLDKEDVTKVDIWIRLKKLFTRTPLFLTRNP